MTFKVCLLGDSRWIDEPAGIVMVISVALNTIDCTFAEPLTMTSCGPILGFPDKLTSLLAARTVRGRKIVIKTYIYLCMLLVFY